MNAEVPPPPQQTNEVLQRILNTVQPAKRRRASYAYLS
jgi:hypothetical protein